MVISSFLIYISHYSFLISHFHLTTFLPLMIYTPFLRVER